MKTSTFLRRSLQSSLFSLIYPNLPLKTINHHVNRLILKLKKPHSCQVLANKTFWEQLIKETDSPGDAEKLHTYWKKIEPLAHLSAKELLTLLNDELRPLEKYLRYSQAVLSDKSHLFQFQWIIDKQASLLDAISLQLNKLEKIKLKVEEALLIRCDVHNVFNVSYYCDDALGQLCIRVNLIQPNLEKLLEEPTPSVIADDERIAIFDILSKSNIGAQILDKTVIAPIRKKPVKTLINKSSVGDLLRDTARFIYEATQSLDQANVIKQLFSFSVKESNQWPIDMTKPLQDLLDKIGLIKIASGFYRFRYGIYLMISIVIYGALMQFLMPLLMATLSMGTIGTVSSLLFFTIGIAPVWYLIVTHSNNFIQSARQLLFSNMQQTLLDSLMLLEKSSFFVASQLSQTIVDIPHFDIEHFLENAKKIQLQLAEHANKLTLKSSWRTWFVSHEFKMLVKNTHFKLIEQSKLIDSRLSLLASRIAQDIGEEITLLCASADNLQLISSLPHNQIENLEKMVTIHGDEQAKEKFKRNTDVVNLWAQKIDVHYFGADISSQDLKLKQPWGGFDIRQDVLRGWKIILSTLISDPQKKAICLRINELLTKESEYTEESLRRDLMILNPMQAESLLKSIQWFLFNTLSQRPASCASLLLSSHKNLIDKWFDQYHDDIQTANDAISTAFQNSTQADAGSGKIIPDATLARHYELLDSADVYYYAKNKVHVLAKRSNLARQYFEEYKGNHPFAYRLVKFVPNKDKANIISKVALKRLQWIMNNLDSSKELFDPIDSEMFLNYRLCYENNNFHFESVVKESAQFNQLYNVNMENFLIQCHSHGFDADNLLGQYVKRHQRSKQMLQMQLHTKNSARKFKGIVERNTQDEVWKNNEIENVSMVI